MASLLKNKEVKIYGIKYGVVRTDNMTGTDVRSELVSVKYMGANKKTATEIENGAF